MSGTPPTAQASPGVVRRPAAAAEPEALRRALELDMPPASAKLAPAHRIPSTGPASAFAATTLPPAPCELSLSAAASPDDVEAQLKAGAGGGAAPGAGPPASPSPPQPSGDVETSDAAAGDATVAQPASATPPPVGPLPVRGQPTEESWGESLGTGKMTSEGQLPSAPAQERPRKGVSPPLLPQAGRGARSSQDGSGQDPTTSAGSGHPSRRPEIWGGGRQRSRQAFQPVTSGQSASQTPRRQDSPVVARRRTVASGTQRSGHSLGRGQRARTPTAERSPVVLAARQASRRPKQASEALAWTKARRIHAFAHSDEDAPAASASPRSRGLSSSRGRSGFDSSPGFPLGGNPVSSAAPGSRSKSAHRSASIRRQIDQLAQARGDKADSPTEPPPPARRSSAQAEAVAQRLYNVAELHRVKAKAAAEAEAMAAAQARKPQLTKAARRLSRDPNETFESLYSDSRRREARMRVRERSAREEERERAPGQPQILKRSASLTRGGSSGIGEVLFQDGQRRLSLLKARQDKAKEDQRQRASKTHLSKGTRALLAAGPVGADGLGSTTSKSDRWARLSTPGHARVRAGEATHTADAGSGAAKQRRSPGQESRLRAASEARLRELADRQVAGRLRTQAALQRAREEQAARDLEGATFRPAPLSSASKRYAKSRTEAKPFPERLFQEAAAKEKRRAEAVAAARAAEEARFGLQTARGKWTEADSDGESDQLPPRGRQSRRSSFASRSAAGSGGRDSVFSRLFSDASAREERRAEVQSKALAELEAAVGVSPVRVAPPDELVLRARARSTSRFLSHLASASNVQVRVESSSFKLHGAAPDTRACSVQGPPRAVECPGASHGGDAPEQELGNPSRLASSHPSPNGSAWHDASGAASTCSHGTSPNHAASLSQRAKSKQDRDDQLRRAWEGRTAFPEGSARCGRPTSLGGTLFVGGGAKSSARKAWRPAGAPPRRARSPTASAVPSSNASVESAGGRHPVVYVPGELISDADQGARAGATGGEPTRSQGNEPVWERLFRDQSRRQALLDVEFALHKAMHTGEAASTLVRSPLVQRGASHALRRSATAAALGQTATQPATPERRSASFKADPMPSAVQVTLEEANAGGGADQMAASDSKLSHLTELPGSDASSPGSRVSGPVASRDAQLEAARADAPQAAVAAHDAPVQGSSLQPPSQAATGGGSDKFSRSESPQDCCGSETPPLDEAVSGGNGSLLRGTTNASPPSSPEDRTADAAAEMEQLPLADCLAAGDGPVASASGGDESEHAAAKPCEAALGRAVHRRSEAEKTSGAQAPRAPCVQAAGPHAEPSEDTDVVRKLALESLELLAAPGHSKQPAAIAAAAGEAQPIGVQAESGASATLSSAVAGHEQVRANGREDAPAAAIEYGADGSFSDSSSSGAGRASELAELDRENSSPAQAGRSDFSADRGSEHGPEQAASQPPAQPAPARPRKSPPKAGKKPKRSRRRHR